MTKFSFKFMGFLLDLKQKAEIVVFETLKCPDILDSIFIILVLPIFSSVA